MRTLSHSPFLLACIVACIVALASCELPQPEVATQEEMRIESSRLRSFLHTYDSLQMDQDPLYAARNGSRQGSGRLSPVDDAQWQLEMGLLTAWRERLAREFDTLKLDQDAVMNYRLFIAYCDQRVDRYHQRRLIFPEDALPAPGTHAFFTKLHPLETQADAEAYVSCIRALPRALKLWREAMLQREADSLLPPAFLLRQIRRQAVQTAGIATADSHLVADPAHPWLTRLSQFHASHPEMAEGAATLQKQAWESYAYEAIPEYQRILEWLFRQEALADTFKVAGRYPDGKDWYGRQLTHYAGVPTTSDDANTLAQGRMEALLAALDQQLTAQRFPGSHRQYLDSLRRSREWHLIPLVPQGRQDFVVAIGKALDSLQEKTQGWLKPPSPALVLRFMESNPESQTQPMGLRVLKGDTLALMVDLGGRQRLESWRWRAMVASLGPTGRWLQEGYLRSLPDTLPRFRHELQQPWMDEGWQLYAMSLPVEEGWYQDSAWRRSVLLVELIATAQLVADVGLNAHGWTRTQAEAYLLEQTPLTQDQVRGVLEQLQSRPGASIASVAGAARIRSWRSQAKAALGDKFQLGSFHQFLLQAGRLPIPMLERQYLSWVNPKQP